MLEQSAQHAVRPKALIAPHAGYVYSGPIAATAYKTLLPVQDSIDRVVLLGPSHFVAVRGLAMSNAESFETPLGRIPIDIDLRDAVLELPQVELLDAAHSREHSLEVHLPFLQRTLRQFSLLPLTVGEATRDEVAEVLERSWGDDSTLIVVSSDLSHYHDYAVARELDRRTCDAIERLAPDEIGPEDACGCRCINGLLESVRRRGLQVTTLELASSGDTAGPRDSVVGYGAWAFA
jgi:AmmeMemoRadiSam system protein B